VLLALVRSAGPALGILSRSVADGVPWEIREGPHRSLVLGLSEGQLGLQSKRTAHGHTDRS